MAAAYNGQQPTAKFNVRLQPLKFNNPPSVGPNEIHLFISSLNVRVRSSLGRTALHDSAPRTLSASSFQSKAVLVAAAVGQQPVVGSGEFC